MKIATAWSTEIETSRAFREAYNNLLEKLGGLPTYLFIAHTEQYAPATLLAEMAAIPASVKVHGCTTCKGVMTEQGFHSKNEQGLGMWGIADSTGDYGVALARKGEDPRASASKALLDALSDAQRSGEVPDLIWLSASPGFEEDVLKGIQDIVGPNVPVFGGSAADNHVLGNWNVFTRSLQATEGILVSVFFSSFSISYSFQSGYVPTGIKGTVTSASGRTIYTIDHDPAADVYQRWTGKVLGSVSQRSNNILAESTLAPLGRVVGKIGGIDYYSLSHPSHIHEDGSLSLFTEVKTGQELQLMSGSTGSLISRAGRVVEAAIAIDDLRLEKVHGVLMVYCAGCMLTVEANMPEVAASINQVLEGRAFFGIFSFGEQGIVLNNCVSHGNLMISSLVFANKD